MPSTPPVDRPGTARLELTGLSVGREGFDFGPVELTVGDEVLAVLGPSGSGKTTLLSVVAGLVSPDGGSISLDGRPLVGVPPEGRNVGLVFQDGALFPHMTARENVAYAADDNGRVETFAAMLEIDDVLDRRPGALSGGERQRVAFARTLAADPDALLLDEPLSSLDAPIRRRLLDQLHELFGSLDVPILYVTHDQRAATALGDRIAVVRDGVVEQVGSPSQVLSRPATRFVAAFTGCNVFEATVSDRSGDGVALAVGTRRLRTSTDPGVPVGSAVAGCVRPSHVRLSSDRDSGISGAGGATDGGGDDAGGRANRLSGTVRRCLNETDGYRVVVDLAGADVDLTAAVPPPAFDRLAVEAGSAVAVSIPPDDVHAIG